MKTNYYAVLGVAVSQRCWFVCMCLREVWSIDGQKRPDQEQPNILPPSRRDRAHRVLETWGPGVNFHFFICNNSKSCCSKDKPEPWFHHGNTPAELPTSLFCCIPTGKRMILSAQAILQTQTQEKLQRWMQKAKGSILSVCLIKHDQHHQIFRKSCAANTNA